MWGTKEEMLEKDPNVFCGKEDEVSMSPHNPQNPFYISKGYVRTYAPSGQSTCRSCSNSPAHPVLQDPTAFGYGALEMYQFEEDAVSNTRNMNYSLSPGLFGSSPLGTGIVTGGGAALGGAVGGAPGAVVGGGLGGFVAQPDRPLGTMAGGALGGGLGYGVGGPLGAGLGGGLGGALGSGIY